MGNATADAERKAVVEARNEADSTVYQTEKTLSEHKDKVPQEDQDKIREDIAAVKEATADEAITVAALKEKVEALKTSSMKIGEAMYKNTSSDSSDGGSSESQSSSSAGGESSESDKDKKKE